MKKEINKFYRKKDSTNFFLLIQRKELKSLIRSKNKNNSINN